MPCIRCLAQGDNLQNCGNFKLRKPHRVLSSANVSMLCLVYRHTQIPQEVLNDYVNELSQVFTPEAYNLFTNNCNNFSNELATFLTGQPIPVSTSALPLLKRNLFLCRYISQGSSLPLTSLPQ